MALGLKISTPEKLVLVAENIQMVSAPGVDGEFSVLPGHAAFATKIKPGIIKIRESSGGLKRIAIGSSFFQVKDDQIIILAEHAILPEEVDRQKAQEAKERARLALEKRLEGTNFQKVEAELRRALLELQFIDTLQNINE